MGFIGSLIGGIIGQAIYAGLMMLVLRWLYKLNAPYGPLFVVYLVLYLILTAIAFVLGLILGPTGALGIVLLIVAIGAFVLQAYVVSQRVKDDNGVLLPFGKVLVSQLIILAVFIVIFTIIQLVFGGF